MLDTRQIHSLSDFVRNPKAHLASLKETRTSEVLTVNGRAEVVLLDTETYESLMDQIRSTEGIAVVRAAIRAAQCAGPQEKVIEEEIKSSEAVMDELVVETERLGLYK